MYGIRMMGLGAIAVGALACQEPVAQGQRERGPLADVDHAVAVLHPTEGHEAQGTVRFETRGSEVRVVADLEGLTPGLHGIHVHEHGDCSAPDASSAGDHYNPADHPHALPPERPRHAGDLGNVRASAEGRARYEATLDGFTIAGDLNPVLGRAVIVHAQPDTGRGPSGEAGARVACGVIGVAAPPG